MANGLGPLRREIEKIKKREGHRTEGGRKTRLEAEEKMCKQRYIFGKNDNYFLTYSCLA